MKKYMVIIVIGLALAVSSHARNNTRADSLLIVARETLENAINLWEEKPLQDSRARFERLLNQTDYPFLVHYYIAYADYNLTNFYQATESSEMAAKYLDDGIQHLEKSIELHENFAESHALLSTLFGQKIALSPLKAMYLGPRSNAAMQKALKLEPTNPRVHLLAGINAKFTPKMFGGGREKARKHLRDAGDLFTRYQPKSLLYPDWGHRDVYAWLGIVAIDSDSLDAAKSYFEKALEIDPNYSWVKYRLLPALEEKMSGDSK
ncbi:MAG: tetratricopeptide repeat protein [Calditrichia bacterium]